MSNRRQLCRHLATLTRRRSLGAGGATLVGTVLLGSSIGGQTQPNFLFVMTDDMPKWMLEHTPMTRERIGGQGLTFENFYGAQPLCFAT